MKLARYLAHLGYGTRRDVERLLAAGAVTGADGHRFGPADVLPAHPDAHATLRVHGEPLDPAPGAVLLLHKPAGYVCSTEDRNPLVYDLLPPRFRLRSPIIAPVGRLDRDTTGLLLLTDDGPLLHRLTSPRSHLPKSYRAALAQPLRGDEAALFASGTLHLDGERTPLAPATLELLGGHDARLTITEGRYHQVRRMFAAVGNHVRALHRDRVGPLTLGTLAEGAWRLLEDAERDALDHALRTARADRASTAGSPPAP